MENAFSREIKLIGEENFKKLKTSSVIVFGAGGVGSFAIEAIARAGVGNITIVDNDTVDETNINRQLIALNSTVGKDKVAVAKARVLDINPNCNVTAVKEFYDNKSLIDITKYDYIVDAIDSVKSKIHLVETAKKNNVKIISSMGTGNKILPEKLTVCDISKTNYCPLAKKMRYELRKRGINHLKVVYSTEEPLTKSVPPASISFVPSVAGLLIAKEVITDLINED